MLPFFILGLNMQLILANIVSFGFGPCKKNLKNTLANILSFKKVSGPTWQKLHNQQLPRGQNHAKWGQELY